MFLRCIGELARNRCHVLAIEMKKIDMNEQNTAGRYPQQPFHYQPVHGQAPQGSERGFPGNGQQQPPAPMRPKGPARMPKARALQLLQKIKRAIVVASFVSFGAFGILAMNHAVGSAAQQATTVTSTTRTTTPAATATQQPTSAATAAAPTATPTPTTTTTQQGGSYGFGPENNSNQPVSGSHTS